MVANLFFRIGIALAAPILASGAALAKITIAIGGAGCLCYLPTVLAEQLGEYRKAGVEIELVNFKGGSQALTAVIGGSADVVSGYYDHCVNLAARNQQLQAFVVYDRFPGLVLGVSPKHAERDQCRQGSRRQEGRRQRAGLIDGLLFEIPAGPLRCRGGRRGRHRHRPRCDGGRRHGAGHGRCRRHARPHPDAAAQQVPGAQDLQRHPHRGRHAGGVRRRISRRRALCARRLDRPA